MQDEFSEFHWMMDMVQTVDVGIVVLDRDYRVRVWNAFMESHSSMLPSQVREKCLFDLFPDLNQKWFRNKCRPVFDFRGRAFITWEQRPYVFKFPNYRPITGTEDFMYQNITLSPLTNTIGKVDYLCMMIYDVTDIAAHKKRSEALEVTLNELQEKLASKEKE
ncbi:PAS domain-containing protein [Paraneptunicella aestuarii]|uniref:PAS domain-containing protein n=1 Tax=Paraneptunicella aestuarii TaxID=2831148 RepID=UPI001E5A472C|nr:PAS domain-containing protein [Paraneptunicella aestuarii]UAA40834.1 PAS domain-containing protein [Paraneptunicella aestuarii]